MSKEAKIVYNVVVYEEQGENLVMTIDSTWKNIECAEKRRIVLQAKRKCTAQIYYSAFHTGELCENCPSKEFHISSRVEDKSFIEPEKKKKKKN